MNTSKGKTILYSGNITKRYSEKHITKELDFFFLGGGVGGWVLSIKKISEKH